MLHYVMEARAEPLAWSDVEALPLYLGAGLIVVATHHLALQLGTELRFVLLKAVALVVLLGLRQMLGVREDEPEAAGQDTGGRFVQEREAAEPASTEWFGSGWFGGGWFGGGRADAPWVDADWSAGAAA